MKNFRWFRKYIGGDWFKYQMTGQLPGCWGSWWTIKKLPPHRYYELIKTESF